LHLRPGADPAAHNQKNPHFGAQSPVILIGRGPGRAAGDAAAAHLPQGGEGIAVRREDNLIGDGIDGVEGADPEGFQLLGKFVRVADAELGDEKKAGELLAHLPGAFKTLVHVSGDLFGRVGAGIIELHRPEEPPQGLPINLQGLQGFGDGGLGAFNEFGVEVGNDVEAQLAGAADIRGAGRGAMVGEAVGVEQAQRRQPADIFPGEGVGGDKVAPPGKAGGRFAEDRGAGFFNRPQKPPVAGQQGIGEKAPPGRSQGGGDDHRGDWSFGVQSPGFQGSSQFFMGLWPTHKA